MKQLSVMIKPASSRCNLRCRYCFYADVSRRREVAGYGFMREDTMRSLIENIYRDLEDGDSVSFAFQGGEPTLAGLPFFETFAAEVEKQPVKARVSWALQTNGTMLDDAWCTFLKKRRFLVGLSLDGYAALHNENRLDAEGRGTFRPVMHAKRLLDRHGVEYNVLCVLTNEAARHPQQIWRFLLDEHIRHVQFIPCLDELGVTRKNPWALTPRRFYSFYAALFPLWQKESLAGNYISVKLYDDIVNLFVRGQVTACGINGRCQPQYIVEADGSVYPCDFYVLDEYRAGSLKDGTLKKAFEHMIRSGFLDPRAMLPATCRACPYLNACRGGCKRMQGAMYVDDGFCGYRALLDGCLQPLCATGRTLIGG